MSEETDEAEYFEHARKELIPMVEQSRISLVLAPRGEPDVKIAMELGLSLWFDKPIIIIKKPGDPLPSRIRKCADEVLEIDLLAPGGQAKLRDAIARIRDRYDR